MLCFFVQVPQLILRDGAWFGRWISISGQSDSRSHLGLVLLISEMGSAEFTSAGLSQVHLRQLWESPQPMLSHQRLGKYLGGGDSISSLH